MIEEIDVERVMVTASVTDSQQLEWWLLGFGARVVMVGPGGLRARMKKTASMMTKKYRNAD